MLAVGKLRPIVISFIAFITILVSALLFSPVGLRTVVQIHYKSTTSSPTLNRKPKPSARPPIEDNFPLAAYSAIPPIPSWNIPLPDAHHPPTPLLISFTRNWLLLQQTVVSYITAGWPANQIYVVDNTGTQFSNRNNRLTLQNPFYLNHARLTSLYNVTVLETPSLLTFAQLQNFFLHTALKREWPYYFWSHMDVVALSDEAYKDPATRKYKSLHARVVDVLNETLSPTKGFDKKDWAGRWFAYDRLALYNTAAFVDVGGWDPFISYYMSDCDMHERLMMAGYTLENANAGYVYDISSSLPDLLVLYRRENVTEAVASEAKAWEDDHNPVHKDDKRSPKSPSPKFTRGAPDFPASPSFHALVTALDEMQEFKNNNEVNPAGRNTWQALQQGGGGEPFHYDPEGFERAIGMEIEHGRAVFKEKWAGDRCGLIERGLGREDAWRVE